MCKHFERIQREEDAAHEGSLKVTAAMCRTVFIETKMNIPFDSHKSLVSLQEMHGVNLGCHHYEKKWCGLDCRIDERPHAFFINDTLLQKISHFQLLSMALPTNQKQSI